MENKKDSKLAPIVVYTFIGAVVLGVLSGMFDWDILGGFCAVVICIIVLGLFGYAAINMTTKNKGKK